MNPFLLLPLAIVSEVFGSSMLKITNGFKKILPSLGVLFGYGIAFYALSLALKTLPLGLAYASWSGVGTAVTALIGVIFWQEVFTAIKIAGLLLIIGDIVLLNSSNNLETEKEPSA